LLVIKLSLARGRNSILRITGYCPALGSSAVISGSVEKSLEGTSMDSINLYVKLVGRVYVWKGGLGWLPTEQSETHVLRLVGEQQTEYGPVSGYQVFTYHGPLYDDLWPPPLHIWGSLIRR
jgi:hypothetical protein